MASYRLNQNAKEDLWRIYQYGFEKFGEAQAYKYLDDFYHHFEIIAQQPQLYSVVDNIRFGYRRCVCGKDSIYYRIVNEVIEIMTIIGQQDTDKWL